MVFADENVFGQPALQTRHYTTCGTPEYFTPEVNGALKKIVPAAAAARQLRGSGRGRGSRSGGRRGCGGGCGRGLAARWLRENILNMFWTFSSGSELFEQFWTFLDFFGSMGAATQFHAPQ